MFNMIYSHHICIFSFIQEYPSLSFTLKKLNMFKGRLWRKIAQSYVTVPLGPVFKQGFQLKTTAVLFFSGKGKPTNLGQTFTPESQPTMLCLPYLVKYGS